MSRATDPPVRPVEPVEPDEPDEGTRAGAGSHGELEAALLARVPELLREVRGGLIDRWPEYADFLEADEEGVQEAAALFVHRLVEMSHLAGPRSGTGPRAGDETVRLVFEQIGRQQMQTGSDLTRLLTAFQLGSRVAWRHVSATALELALAPDSLAALADAVFVFVNQLSYAAANGYLLEQIDDARARERNREELATLLLSDRTSAEAIHVAAARAGWRVPDKAAVVLVDPEDEAARKVLDRLDPGCLPVRLQDAYGAIVPEPTGPGRRTQLVRQLQGANAVVGYGVPLSVLPRSTEVARIAARLRHDGLLRGDPVFAEEHLDTIIVWRDRGLTDALRRRVLAPLAELPEGTRARLEETLTCWLEHQGDRRRMAEALSIHPQTVRYRMGQLQELFGDALTDPESRARLFLALQWAVD